jgi:hypothetical protein
VHHWAWLGLPAIALSGRYLGGHYAPDENLERISAGTVELAGWFGLISEGYGAPASMPIIASTMEVSR